jgi:hypothetical protein
MKTISKLTLSDLKAMKPHPDLLAFAESCHGDMQKFWEECPNGAWLLWILCKTKSLPDLKARAIAHAYARKVLPVFEIYNPHNTRVRECLDSVKVFLKYPTVENQRLMFNAAMFAHSVYTSYAAAAAAYFAAHDRSGIFSADTAVHMAATAVDAFELGQNSCGCQRSNKVREKLERWGATKVRAIIKLQKKKSPKRRLQSPNRN